MAIITGNAKTFLILFPILNERWMVFWPCISVLSTRTVDTFFHDNVCNVRWHCAHQLLKYTLIWCTDAWYITTITHSLIWKSDVMYCNKMSKFTYSDNLGVYFSSACVYTAWLLSVQVSVVCSSVVHKLWFLDFSVTAAWIQTKNIMGSCLFFFFFFSIFSFLRFFCFVLFLFFCFFIFVNMRPYGSENVKILSSSFHPITVKPYDK